MNDAPNKPDRPSSSYAVPLLTVADIVRLKVDYDADVRLMEELPARIKLKKRRYEAALLFAPAGFNPEAPLPQEPAPEAEHATEEPIALAEPPVPDFELAAQTAGDDDEEVEAEGRLTWIGELSRILESATRGMSHQEVLAMLKATKLGERSSSGEKGFYNAVGRLEKRGSLIKNGGLLYSPRLIEEMKARGETLPNVSLEARRRAGGSATVALAVLRAHPDGLDANQLRAELAELPGIPSSIQKHTHYIYNVLATLMGQGEVAKDASGIYTALREKS